MTTGLRALFVPIVKLQITSFVAMGLITLLVLGAMAALFIALFFLAVKAAKKASSEIQGQSQAQDQAHNRPPAADLAQSRSEWQRQVAQLQQAQRPDNLPTN